jgi:pyrimidine operon attenuation protein/uracil phosphoribosyltransferase
MIGIHTGGAWVAEGCTRFSLPEPLGLMDVRLHRDDYRAGLHHDPKRTKRRST